MPQFLSVIPEVDASVTSNAGFLKGLLTAMLELGALIGALQAGFIADKISRKYTLAVGIAWFIVGSTIQTATVNYAMLVVGRTIGGIGVGVLSTSTCPLLFVFVRSSSLSLIADQYLTGQPFSGSDLHCRDLAAASARSAPRRRGGCHRRWHRRHVVRPAWPLSHRLILVCC